MTSFATSLQHVLAELERIDLLIQVQVWHARQLNANEDAFQGLYIAEKEVDTLLSGPAGLPRWAAAPLPLASDQVGAALDQLRTSIAARKTASAECGVVLRLDALARLVGLSPFEVDVLLICLAPEIDLRYERLYAYLQDDVTKKRPSVDLVLNLLSPSFEAKLLGRQCFAPQAPLLRYGLVQIFEILTHQHPPLLSKYLRADERIVEYLFDSDEIDARLLPYARAVSPSHRMDDLLLPADLKGRLVALAGEQQRKSEPLVLYFQGPYGVGKQTTADALCQQSGIGMLAIDGEKLLGAENLAFEMAVRMSMREALLQHSLLYWDGFDALLADDRRAWRDMLLHALEQQPGMTILAGDTIWEPADVLNSLPFMRVEFRRPGYAERLQFWARSLDGHRPEGGDENLSALATKFRFTAGQIRDATATALNLARWRDPENGQVVLDDLHAASRLQSNRKLATLARKITPHYTWESIVLPDSRLQQLREICNQVKYRARVYDEWGFDRKLSLGKGLNVLFAGPSGTGKTMAAEIMAGELKLDLYKIDLSTVVSKYIGETEKNLARIFAEAETSNAILFFDEADALFGKRSEVRDSHDRYANIEISYLLQRMEEYDGMVILATNLHKNMDEAFVRRMHFTIEFPFPDVRQRRQIWEKIWPSETPRGTDLDLDFMAQRFEITGGSIRNVALAAAFLAADDCATQAAAGEERGQCIHMRHLVRATQREFQKMGKVVADGEFGKYAKHL